MAFLSDSSPARASRVNAWLGLAAVASLAVIGLALALDLDGGAGSGQGPKNAPVVLGDPVAPAEARGGGAELAALDPAARTADEVGPAGRVGAEIPDGARAAASDPARQEWTLRVKLRRTLPGAALRSGDGASEVRSGAYFGIVFLADGAQRSLGRLRLPEEGTAEIRFTPRGPEDWLTTSSIALSNVPAGIALGKEVFLEGPQRRFGAGSRARPVRGGMALADAVSVDAAARVVDLGTLKLTPAPKLGTLMVGPNSNVDGFQAFVSAEPLATGAAGRFGARTPGRLRALPSMGGEATAYSFFPGERWSVLLKDSNGELLASDEAERGEVIEFLYEPPTGLRIRLDLTATPGAARVLVMGADQGPDGAIGKGALGEEAYAARLALADTSVAVPLERFRGAMRFLETGMLELEPGSKWVEVWGKEGADGWRLLGSRAVDLVAGEVEVNL